MAGLTLSGRVVTGLGQGASFTQVDWARNQFLTRLGIDPHPGTLNLILESPADLATWAGLKTQTGCVVTAAEPGWCDARCYPVRLAGRLPAAIIYPEVPGYPAAQVEIIAALPLRRELALADGDDLELEICRPLPVQAVIFDVDGTLVDSLEAYRIVAALAAAPYGLSITRQVVRHALNTNHPSFWELVVPNGQPDRAGLIETLKQAARRRWPEVVQKHARLYPGLRATLETLRGRGFRLAIVTGSSGGSLQPLAEAGLLDFFEAVVTGKDVERRKPDPDGLYRGVAALGLEPGQAVYVGDTPVDVEASRAAGMAAVAVLSGAGDSALLSAAGPDRLIFDHTHLPEILEASETQ